MINYNKRGTLYVAVLSMSLVLTACSSKTKTANSQTAEVTTASSSTNTTSVADTDLNSLISTLESGVSLELDENDTNTSFDDSCVNIDLANVSSNLNGVSYSNNTLTITKKGSYCLSGSLNGQIVINLEDNTDEVHLIFNGVTITNNESAPVLILSADKVTITLADNTVNTITDGERSSANEDYSAAIYSKEDLTFNGNGTLNVNGNYKDGITSKDDLIFVSGIINVTATDDGIVGKDLVGINNGEFNISAGGDGIKSTNDTDSTRGYIIIENGNIDITAGNDGIQGENYVAINNGNINIKTGNGASNSSVSHSSTDFGFRAAMGNSQNAMGNNQAAMGPGQNAASANTGNNSNANSASTDTNTDTNTDTSTDTESLKGIKATNVLICFSGTINIDSEDDGVHTDGAVIIKDGTFNIASGDDGIHADSLIKVDGGSLNITKSYEGLESTAIEINGGNVKITSEDDGMNASDGQTNTIGYGNTSNSQSTAVSLVINAGNVYVNSTGDGLDSNGTMTINGGEIIVEGPTSNDNTAIDFDSSLTINGGTLMAFGSNGMIETPTSATNGAALILTGSGSSNQEFSLKDSSGNTILNYTPSKSYQAVICYSQNISQGSTYTYTIGQSSESVTVTSAVTSTANTSGFGAQKGGNMGQMPESANQGRNAYK